jgi:hypothetical protein
VFVESILSGNGRWQISTNGAFWPVWRRDGRELFFTQGGKMMAVPIQRTEKSVSVVKAQLLFEGPGLSRFQVSRDGQRFLVALPVEGTACGASAHRRYGLARGIGKRFVFLD